MARQTKLWRPAGKNDGEILASLIGEAQKLVSRFDTIKDRHSVEIETYRDEHPVGRSDLDSRQWLEETVLKKMLELGEPDSFNFEFHERRRDILSSLESGEPFDVGQEFIKIAKITGIVPLLGTILNMHRDLDQVYEAPVDPREPPSFNAYVFDWLEMDATVLRLYVTAEAHYGFDTILSLMREKNYPNQKPSP